MKFKFSDYFSPNDLESLAISTGFSCRQSRKITPYNFIISFLTVTNTRTFSLRNWANEISNLINDKVSFQAVHKKLTIRHLPFLSTLFSSILCSSFKAQTSISEGLLSKFNRVLVEDSTCVKLRNSMFHYFSGNSNGVCRKAISRIQLCIDIKRGKMVKSELTTYSRNDQSYAGEIVEHLQKNDLLIRDLGYWNIGLLKAINDNGAYFISRLRNNTKLYTAGNQVFDLVKFLKSQDKKGVKSIKLHVKIGEKEKLKICLIGKKMSSQEYKNRLKNTKQGRHKNSNISKNTLYLLNWSLMITNVEEGRLNQKEIYSLYAVRWQIEMFFKNWKSNYNIDKLLLAPKGADPIKPEILMYLSLINLASIYQPNFVYYRDTILKRYNKIISPLKFAEFLKSIFLKNISKAIILDRLKNYCCYEERKDRINMQQKLLDLGLG